MKTILIPIALGLSLIFSLTIFGETVGFDLNKFYTEKRALVKENLVLTDKESQAFWPLYDDYMQGFAKRLNQRIEFERKFAKSQKDITEDFCNCSAGWYKLYWDQLFEKPVRIEPVKTALKGDFECKFVIHIPDNA